MNIHPDYFIIGVLVFFISRGGSMRRNARKSATAKKMNDALYDENRFAIIPEGKMII